MLMGAVMGCPAVNHSQRCDYVMCGVAGPLRGGVMSCREEPCSEGGCQLCSEQGRLMAAGEG